MGLSVDSDQFSLIKLQSEINKMKSLVGISDVHSLKH